MLAQSSQAPSPQNSTNPIAKRHTDGLLSFYPNRDDGPFTLQGTSSKTFRVPDGLVDGKLPLPAVWDFHYTNSQDHPLWIWDTHETEATAKKTQIGTWGQAVSATYRSVHLVNNHLARLNIIPSSPEFPDANPVVGVLALTDTPTFWAVMTGIMRAGHTVFLISPRNSSEALVHLLLATGTSAFFASSDQGVQELSKAALEILKKKQAEGESKLKGILIDDMMLRLPTFDELYDLGSEPRNDFEVPPPFDTSDAMISRRCMILHTSGSTSYPKPIPFTWKNFRNLTLFSYYGDVDFCGRIVSAHSTPLFHTIGVAVSMAFPTSSGITCAVFNPKARTASPTGPPNSTSTLEAIVATRCSVIFTVPAFFENWSKSDSAIKVLAELDIAYFGGGPMQKGPGDKLVDAGVNLKSFYGTTEFGSPVVHSSEKSTRDDWGYFRLSTQYRLYLEPQNDAEETYQLLVLEPPPNLTRIVTPCVLDSEFEGVRSYATGDLLQRHPTDPCLWRVYGRQDDQIMHSTGEKTNPVPLENIISRHPFIQRCVMFGRGEYQPGLLVEPIPAKSFEPQDKARLVNFRNEIWPSIQEANAFAPKHSRIFKDMVIVTDPLRPMQLTAKHTIRRKIVLDQYADEIISAYKKVEEVTERRINIPVNWNIQECTDYVRNVVKRTLLRKEILDNEDFFQLGADSLQAIAMRNMVIYALRNVTKLGGLEQLKVSETLIYDNPTISSLGKYLSHLTSEPDSDFISLNGSTTEYMVNMVEELTNSFPQHTPRFTGSERDANETILITGTTGALGSYILAKLVSTPSVKTIFALNRRDKSGTTLKKRQVLAFQKQGISIELLESDKIVFLEGDISIHDLGLEEKLLNNIVESVTCIVHTAWTVDFNITLPSYEPQLKGLRHILDLALRSSHQEPPRIIFTSSISSVQGWKGSLFVPEGPLHNPEFALQTGYGQSKWVAEQVLDVAGKTTPLQIIIVRVGQLCGSETHGSWNPWEWFPALVQSAKIPGVECLPSAEGVASWVPIDIAAAVLVEMRNAPNILRSNQSLYLHLSHPRPASMGFLMGSIASALGVPIVTYKEWFSKLESVAEEEMDAIKLHPALRLVPFYRAFQTSSVSEVFSEAESYIKTRLAVDLSSKVSPTLGGCNPVGNSDVSKWLAHWGLV